jgi:hypothetical protein
MMRSMFPGSKKSGGETLFWRQLPTSCERD